LEQAQRAVNQRLMAVEALNDDDSSPFPETRSEPGGDGSIDEQALQIALRSGKAAQARAEEAARWAEDEHLSQVAPILAKAVRSLSTWLRTAGVALAENVRRFQAELQDKRQQRHMLYDEIHAIRAEVCDPYLHIVRVAYGLL
jgi:chromosome segregation ATPase